MRRYLLIFLCLLAFPTYASAITFDAVSSSIGNTSTSHDHTIAADANIVVIGLSLRDGGSTVGSASVVGVTVGGQPASFLCGGGTTNVRTEFWYKLAPLTGAQTVVVDASNGGFVDQMVTGVMSFKNVAQGGTFGACTHVTINNITDVDANSIASAPGELGIMIVATNAAPTCSADAATSISTERYDTQNFGNATGCGYTEAGASTLDMRVDLSVTQNRVASAVSMRPIRAMGAPMMFQ